jgi:hypothetical protein
MTETLMELIRRARAINMTPQQEREQRVSFVYGNTKIENERITRELVREVDAEMSKADEKR